MEYLKHKDLPFHLNYDRETRELQRAVTYCAKACPIGNLRHDNDFELYKFVDVKGGEQIPETIDRLDSRKFIKSAISNRLNFHKMTDMYEALKTSEYQHDAI